MDWKDFYNIEDDDILTGKQLTRLAKQPIKEDIKAQIRKEIRQSFKDGTYLKKEGSVSTERVLELIHGRGYKPKTVRNFAKKEQ